QRRHEGQERDDGDAGGEQAHPVGFGALDGPHRHVLPPPGRHLARAAGAAPPVGPLLGEAGACSGLVHAPPLPATAPANPGRARRGAGPAGPAPRAAGAPAGRRQPICAVVASATSVRPSPALRTTSVMPAPDRFEKAMAPSSTTRAAAAMA